MHAPGVIPKTAAAGRGNKSVDPHDTMLLDLDIISYHIQDLYRYISGS